MEAASSSTSQHTSPSQGKKSFVSSAQIQLRPKSVKGKNQELKPQPAEIELTTLNSADAKPTKKSEIQTEDPSPVTTRKKPATASEQLAVKSNANALSSESGRTATTSFATTSGDGPTFPLLSRSRKDRKRWNAMEEADSHKGFRTSFKRMMGCASSLDAMYDDPMPVVVFGATGLVGGAVARALLKDRRFEVKAVTRTPTTDAARRLAEEGAIIVTADLNDPRSVTRALEGAHAVFLVTHYWEHLNKDKEITQGKNCVDAAVSSGVGHFIYFGSESPAEVTGGQCAFMESKAAIEKYIKTTTLPYTIIRAPFYYENFLSVFKPHRVRIGVFAVALPMEDKPLELTAVQDVGRCVLRVLLRPKQFLCRVVPLGTERLTIQQITDIFSKHFSDRKFISPKIRVKDYESFGFDGAKDIAAMFEYLQHGGLEPRDPKLARKVQVSPISFDRWVADNKQKLAENMNSV